MSIDADGEMYRMDMNLSSKLGATFTRAATGVQVSVEVKSFSATQTNPMGAPVTADGSGISGPVVFTLDRQGVATLVAEPQLTGMARNYFQPLEVVHGFFPRLPGRAAHVGDTWTDTISFEGPQGDGSIRSTSIVTYTVLGDTLVGDRRVLKIAMEGSTEQSASGAFAGMDFSQKLSGTAKGWVLWDLQRSLMVEKYSDNDASGTMDVSVAPYPLSIRMRGQARTRLAEEM
ncbi:MAG: hypothetical protein LJF04_14440 [Gemmatimonadetes bacterium]|nr:hypothetical protein [Gemmatimonadota bacterium]